MHWRTSVRWRQVFFSLTLSLIFSWEISFRFSQWTSTNTHPVWKFDSATNLIPVCCSWGILMNATKWFISNEFNCWVAQFQFNNVSMSIFFCSLDIFWICIFRQILLDCELDNQKHFNPSSDPTSNISYGEYCNFFKSTDRERVEKIKKIATA